MVPSSASAFDQPEFQFLEQYGFRLAGEHKWSPDGDSIRLILSSGGEALISLTEKKLSFDSRYTYDLVEAGSQ